MDNLDKQNITLSQPSYFVISCFLLFINEISMDSSTRCEFVLYLDVLFGILNIRISNSYEYFYIKQLWF